MRTRTSLLLAGVVIGILMLTRPPSAQPPVPLASFYGIGDLPGGLTTSIVRDATKVGGTIYAVGSSAAAANPNLDTAAIWTFDGANPATLTELPLNTLGGGGPTAAAAITPGAAGASFIASQARYSVSGPRSDGGVSTLTRVQPVRVERTATYPTENLNAAPFPTYVSTISLIGGLTAILPTNSSAVAISDDGSILYGATQQTIGASTFGRAVRFDFSHLPGDNVLIPLLNPGDTTNGPAARGTSADGSVMVGVSFGGPAGANAFRYEHGNPGYGCAHPASAWRYGQQSRGGFTGREPDARRGHQRALCLPPERDVPARCPDRRHHQAGFAEHRLGGYGVSRHDR